MGQTYSFRKLTQKQFSTYNFDQETEAMIGDTSVGFSMIVYGLSGNGKTTFVGRLIKNLCRYGKVYYNSIEEGFSKTLQQMAIRAGLDEIDPAVLVLGDKDTFSEMCDKLKTNRAMFVVVDSVQAARMTIDEWNVLRRRFKNKALIVISWEGSGKEPKGQSAQDIKYWSDIKIRVFRGIAYIDSRYGFTPNFHVPYVYEKFHNPMALEAMVSKNKKVPPALIAEEQEVLETEIEENNEKSN